MERGLGPAFMRSTPCPGMLGSLVRVKVQETLGKHVVQKMADSGCGKQNGGPCSASLRTKLNLYLSLSQ